VFPAVVDPVGAGFVETLARPGGNATGFMTMEYSLSGKWLELLKEAASRITRVAVFRDPNQGSANSQYAALQGAAASLKVEVVPIFGRVTAEIERAFSAFARQPNGGLIVVSGAVAQTYRNAIVKLAAQHEIPAVYYDRPFVTAGGLISYGADLIDGHRHAAGLR
jgi:putative tryptophan/tyrosine transport system substrate-binding protein